MGKGKVRRPTPINPLPRADLRAEPNERIATFEGGLISTRWITDDAGMEVLHVALYGLADSIEHSESHTLVTTPSTVLTNRTGTRVGPSAMLREARRSDDRRTSAQGDA